MWGCGVKGKLQRLGRALCVEEKVADWIRKVLMIFRIDSGIEFVMENLLDQSQGGHEKDNTKRNTNDSEAATRGKLW